MHRRGFTLIELLVVVMIMGILLAMSVVGVSKMINRGRIRGAADKITQELSGARERAFSRGNAITLTFAATGPGGLQISSPGESIQPFDDCRLGLITSGAPGSKVANCFTAAGAPPTSGIDFNGGSSCTFSPQGTCQPIGALYIRSLDGTIQYAIGVNANGKVTKFEWGGTAWK